MHATAEDGTAAADETVHAHDVEDFNGHDGGDNGRSVDDTRRHMSTGESRVFGATGLQLYT